MIIEISLTLLAILVIGAYFYHSSSPSPNIPTLGTDLSTNVPTTQITVPASTPVATPAATSISTPATTSVSTPAANISTPVAIVSTPAKLTTVPVYIRKPNYNYINGQVNPKMDSPDGNTKYLGSFDNVDACEAACSASDTCRFYTLVGAGGDTYANQCWGMAKISPTSQNAYGVFSGDKQ